LELQEERFGSVEEKLEQTKKTHQKMVSYIQDMDNRKQVQPCPECQTPLIIQSQQIQRIHLKPISEEEKKKEMEYRKKEPLFKKQYDQLLKMNMKKEEYIKEQTQLESLGVTSIPDSELEMIESIQKQIQMNVMLTQQLESKKKQNPVMKYDSMLQRIQKMQVPTNKGVYCESIELVTRKCIEYKDMEKEQERLKRQKRQLEKDLDDKKSEYNQIQMTSLHSLQEQIERDAILLQETELKMEHIHPKIMEYQTYYYQVKNYLEYKRKRKEIQEYKNLNRIYQIQLEQLELLFQHIIQSESVCLEQFIMTVNQKLMEYAERFFPDQSIQMKLSSEKENKSGQVKNEICLMISQHQQEIELKNLSGGEYDRCMLAFLLTINELSHSPCLFLDESISSLDLALSEEVLEVIKEKVGNITLLISHQANTGFFDHIHTI
jgi:hypothetical protein